jgi:MarR family transcriptional regulator, organic hydroperoxide resistance regulator
MVLASDTRKVTSSPEAGEFAKTIHGMIRVLMSRLQPIVEAEGISKGQFWAMHTVSDMGVASVNDVARRLAVSPPSMCVTVDQLEEAGLVTRNRSSRDRRTVEVSLTPKGLKVEARVWALIERDVARAIGGLPRSEVATTTRVISEMNRRLDVTQGSC